MSKLLVPQTNKVFTTTSGGSSDENEKITKKFLQARQHTLERLLSKFNALIYWLSSSDISEFENRVEEVREDFLNNLPVFSDEDIFLLSRIIKEIDLLRLLSIARLLGPLLENERYSQQASFMIRELLNHSQPEVRYAALEAISFALGETPRADRLLAEAKDLLKNEKVTFIQEYLECL